MNGKNHPSNNPLMVVGSNVGSDSFKKRTRGFTKEPVKKRTGF